jgi:hypothetical protein
MESATLVMREVSSHVAIFGSLEEVKLTFADSFRTQRLPPSA